MSSRIRRWAIRQGVSAALRISKALLYAQSYREYGSGVLVDLVDSLGECRDCRRSLSSRSFRGLCDHHAYAFDLLTNHGADAYNEYIEHHHEQRINEAETMEELAYALWKRDVDAAGDSE